MAAVPSIGRASRVERSAPPGAAAASELYERYSAQILGYCLNQLGSREEAEDAVQTTFMNAFRGLARGVVPEAEQAWLFKIAHNVCLSRRRSSWRRGRVEAPNNMEVLQEIVPAQEKVADELIRLQDVLEEMPASQRRAILLREWQGLSYREIAGELEVSQAAVEALIFRARRALAAGLEQTSLGALGRRLRRGADVGGVLAFLKALLGGGGTAAVKIATALAVAGAAVATGADHLRAEHRAPAASNASAAIGAPPAAAELTSAPTPLISDVSSAPPRAASPPPTRPRVPEHPRPASLAPTPPTPTSSPSSPPPSRAPQQPPVAPAAAKPALVTAAAPSAVNAAPPPPPKPEKTRDDPDPGRAETPARPKPMPNPGNGHTKPQRGEQSPPAAPEVETPAAAPVEEPAKSTPPGQESKPEKESKDNGGDNGSGGENGNGGNGRGK